jgi:hypothetical protein
MDKIPNAAIYEDFAYHVALLREFSKDTADGGGSRGTKSLSRRDRKSIRRMSSSGNLQSLGNAGMLTNSNGSFHSTGSGRRGWGRAQPPSSVHAGNLFGKISTPSSKQHRERSNSLNQ